MTSRFLGSTKAYRYALRLCSAAKDTKRRQFDALPDGMSDIKPDKEKPTEKIDGVAAIMTLDRAVRNGGSAGNPMMEVL